MEKLIAVFLVAMISVTSASAFACPKGTHPRGGTGSHHKGGYCSR